MVRLGDICIQITDGSHNPPTGVGESKYLMLSSKNIDDDCITLNDPRYLSKDDFDTENKRTNIEANDLLMTIVGTIGRVAIVPNRLTNICVQRSVAVLKPKSDIVYNRFLMYYLQNMRPHLEQESRGVAQKGIYLKQIGNLAISLPSLDEQRRIAAVLDKVSDLIAKRRQQLDKLDELVKARFVEMFGDPVVNPYRFPMVKLGSVLTVEPQNGLYKPQSDYVVDGSGIPILRIDGFYNGKVTDFQKLKRLLCSDEEIQKFLLHENDIVINRVNSIEYLGKCGLIQGLLEETVYESNMMRLHIDESKFNVHYIVYLLCSQFIYNQILGKAKKSVNQASINQKDVQGLMVYIPALALQNQFAALVEQTEKTKATVSRSLEKLETLKKALMQKYFG